MSATVPMRDRAEQDLAEAQKLVDTLTAERDAVIKRRGAEMTRANNALERIEPALAKAKGRRDYFAKHPDLPDAEATT